MIGILKWIFVGLVILSLIGGAVEFRATEQDWSLVVNKKTALDSIENGGVKIYDFFIEIFGYADTISADSTVEKPR